MMVEGCFAGITLLKEKGYRKNDNLTKKFGKRVGLS
jgi:hypothetical protein